tara:strand:+ start:1301 stop:1495 length:195 start_codon:yes stop_codon:yes gene_type:complete
VHVKISSKFTACAASVENVAKHLLVTVKHRDGCIPFKLWEEAGFVKKSSSLVGIFDEDLEVTVN